MGSSRRAKKSMHDMTDFDLTYAKYETKLRKSGLSDKEIKKELLNFRREYIEKRSRGKITIGLLMIIVFYPLSWIGTYKIPSIAWFPFFVGVLIGVWNLLVGIYSLIEVVKGVNRIFISILGLFFLIAGVYYIVHLPLSISPYFDETFLLFSYLFIACGFVMVILPIGNGYNYCDEWVSFGIFLLMLPLLVGDRNYLTAAAFIPGSIILIIAAMCLFRIKKQVPKYILVSCFGLSLILLRFLCPSLTEFIHKSSLPGISFFIILIGFFIFVSGLMGIKEQIA